MAPGPSGRENKRDTDARCSKILRISCHVNARGMARSRRESRKPRMEKLTDTGPPPLPGRSPAPVLTGPCAPCAA
jgi:hypothetical protein